MPLSTNFKVQQGLDSFRVEMDAEQARKLDKAVYELQLFQEFGKPRTCDVFTLFRRLWWRHMAVQIVFKFRPHLLNATYGQLLTGIRNVARIGLKRL